MPSYQPVTQQQPRTARGGQRSQCLACIAEHCFPPTSYYVAPRPHPTLPSSLIPGGRRKTPFEPFHHFRSGQDRRLWRGEHGTGLPSVGLSTSCSPVVGPATMVGGVVPVPTLLKGWIHMHQLRDCESMTEWKVPKCCVGHRSSPIATLHGSCQAALRGILSIQRWAARAGRQFHTCGAPLRHATQRRSPIPISRDISCRRHFVLHTFGESYVFCNSPIPCFSRIVLFLSFLSFLSLCALLVYFPFFFSTLGLWFFLLAFLHSVLLPVMFLLFALYSLSAAVVWSLDFLLSAPVTHCIVLFCCFYFNILVSR